MFAKFTLGYNHAPPASTPAEHLQPFERNRILGPREGGWSYQEIAAHVGHNVSVVYRSFQQLSVEYSRTCRLGSGRAHITHARQDRRIVRAGVVARTASKEKIQVHVAPYVTLRTIGNSLLAAGHGHTCLWSGYH